MKNCIECGDEFEPKNPKGVFCGAACRQKDYRKRTAAFLKIARGKAKASDLESGLTEQAKKEIETVKIVDLPQRSFNGPKFPSTFNEDDPLSFDKLMQGMAPEGSLGSFAYALQSAQTLQELESVGFQIKKSTLSGVEKLKLHNLGQSIANDKFNF